MVTVGRHGSDVHFVDGGTTVRSTGNGLVLENLETGEQARPAARPERSLAGAWWGRAVERCADAQSPSLRAACGPRAHNKHRTRFIKTRLARHAVMRALGGALPFAAHKAPLGPV